MNLSAQVTLDLPNIDDESRRKFYEKLQQEKWRKIGDITTTWKITFVAEFTPQTALEALKTDLANAAKIAKASYTASIAIGFEPIKVSG
ncbi:hypothetical protein [Bdellovibrio sp.]|uniref:hypothetical protein n=1 Tax=Bdellovibrio sp. TaxID=28201 RepID=UPI0039E58105